MTQSDGILSLSDASMRQRALEFGRYALSRPRVYLDTCFWVRLREEHAGQGGGPGMRELARTLDESVEAGLLHCPLEATGLLEWARQDDWGTRDEAAALMDRLSGGLCLAPPPHRRNVELRCLLHMALGTPPARLHPPRELVWVRPCHLIGRQLPIVPNATEEQQEALWSLFEEHAWKMGLRDVLQRLQEIPDELRKGRAAHVAVINEQQRQHADELRSFQQTLAIELRGGMEELCEELLAALGDVLPAAAPQWPEATDERALKELVPRVARLVARAGQKGKIDDLLPSVVIPASLHAVVRWDKQRSLKPTDLEDFAHAAAALPYCDIFLTDRDLAAKLKSSHVGLDKRYGCVVTASAEEAVAAISALANP